jgi:hypothetical protein
MGKSTTATPPDPRLAEAQIESLNTQGQVGRQMLTNAREMAPIQREQLQLGLDANRTAYDQSQADREYALGKRSQYDAALAPMLNEAEKFDEASRRQELMQQAQADISMQYSAAQDQQGRAMAARGVDPGSGKALMMSQQGELAEAAARSKAALMVSEAAKQEGLQLRGGAIDALKGFPAQASSLTPVGSALGLGGLDVANTGLSGMQGGLGAVGKAAGAAGENATGMYSAQSKIAAATDAASDKENRELIGSGLGLATMGAAKGYRDYKGSKGWFAT